MPAIAALSQHIGGGQAMQLTFQTLLLGDVFGNTNNHAALLGASHAGADETLVTEPAQLAISANDAVLARLHRTGFQHLGQAFGSVVDIVRIDAVAPFAIIGQKQRGGTTEDTLIGRADIDHPLLVPVEGPEHGIDATKQAAEQLLTLAQALHFGPTVQQGQGQRLQLGNSLALIIHYSGHPVPRLS